MVTIEKQPNKSAYRKLSFLERNYISRATNVVMAAKIQGQISDQEIDAALQKILKKYPITGVRFELDREGNCWLLPTNLSKLPLTIHERSPEQWTQVIEEEQRHIFNFETGPMIRFTLMRSGDKTTLIVNCHHSICDGLSLCFLLSDTLHFVAEPDSELGTISDPTLSLEQVIPFKSTGTIRQKIAIWSFNKRWKKTGVSFNFQDYKRLFDKYWKENPENRVTATYLQTHELQTLIKNCKQHQVTVNTALLTALLATQLEQQERKERKIKIIIPVNVRERYSVKAEKTFGFFALGSFVEYNYDKTLGFWENTQKFQKMLELKLGDEEISHGQIKRLLSPFLWDSQYFVRYGFLDNCVSESLLGRSKLLEEVSFLPVTNLGMVKIPRTFGRLKLEAVFGPCVFAGDAEKVVGITTVNDTLTVTVSYNGQTMDSGRIGQFLSAALGYLNYTQNSESRTI